jgi:hypothetical protein
MLVRLLPGRGGDGTEFPITVLNGTGSNIMSIFSGDLQQLGQKDTYTGWSGVIAVMNAAGGRYFHPGILVQVRLVNANHTVMSDWINEQAICKACHPGVPRLSGTAIRDFMYLATAPGNDVLAVSSDKPGLLALLP